MPPHDQQLRWDLNQLGLLVPLQVLVTTHFVNITWPSLLVSDIYQASPISNDSSCAVALVVGNTKVPASSIAGAGERRGFSLTSDAEGTKTVKV